MEEHQSFQSCTRGISSVLGRIAPKADSVDSCGRDRADYESLLNLHVYLLQSRGYTDSRYLNRAVVNRGFDFGRQVRIANGRQESLDFEVSVEPDIEGQLIRRDLLNKLRVRLEAADWLLLNVYAQNDGSVRATWRDFDPSISEGAFAKKLQKLFVACRKILKRIDKKSIIF